LVVKLFVFLCASRLGGNDTDDDLAMSDHKRDTAAHFSRQAEAYAASPSHARGADLDIVAEFAAPGADDICLDVACGPGHTACAWPRWRAG
jgi:hypothetical protein